MGDMRCILDTDVLIAGLRSATGASRYIIELIGRREITAIASVGMMMEYEEVLKRPEHLAAANLTSEQADSLLDAFASLFELVSLHFLWRPTLKDPDDEMILEAAVNGQADVILTFNTRHFTQAALRFGIETMKPSTFLRRYKL
jgi:putative PIN family toxin of toxin-antitoxin system